MMNTQPVQYVLPPPPPSEPAIERWRTVARAFGEVLLTGGLVLLLFVVYELFVTDVLTERRQEVLSGRLQEEWDREGPAPAAHESKVGNAFAVLHIPRFGAGYERVVLEGTAETQLAQGPGHYSETAMPGELGNVAIAGHRVGRGSPFLELERLQPGDPIVVETAESWFVYRVLGDRATGDVTADPSGIPGRQIVRPEAVEVISPTPNAPADAAPTDAYLTLTTCHPRYSAEQRLIVHARLDGGTISKAEQPNGPAALLEH